MNGVINMGANGQTEQIPQGEQVSACNLALPTKLSSEDTALLAPVLKRWNELQIEQYGLKATADHLMTHFRSKYQMGGQDEIDITGTIIRR